MAFNVGFAFNEDIDVVEVHTNPVSAGLLDLLVPSACIYNEGRKGD